MYRAVSPKVSRFLRGARLYSVTCEIIDFGPFSDRGSETEPSLEIEVLPQPAAIYEYDAPERRAAGG